jgi:RNase H-like domain found in reverse transcriptase
VYALRAAETKKQLRQILGFFSFFRDYLPNFAEIARPLTDLTVKRVPNRIPWGEAQQRSLDKLKELLVEATVNPLAIVEIEKPFSIYVDASDYAAGGILTQCMEDDTEKPIAFASCKFNSTQRNWATIEKEAFSAIWALHKFKHWVFGRPVTLCTDHNPITYLTESSPKSAKLMRWMLAISEFEVNFKYRAGRLNEAADCVSRMTTSPGDETQSGIE